MIVITCAAINVYKVHRNEISTSFSYVLSVLITVLLPLYTLGLTLYLCKHNTRLETKQMKDRIGAAYENLSTKGHSRKYAITFMTLRHLRVFGLAFTITFALSNLVT